MKQVLAWMCAALLGGCSLSSGFPPGTPEFPDKATPEILAQCPDFKGTFEDWDSEWESRSSWKTASYGGITDLFCIRERNPESGLCVRNVGAILIGAGDDYNFRKRFYSQGVRFGQRKKGETFEVTFRQTGPRTVWTSFKGSQGTEGEAELQFFSEGFNTCKDGMLIKGSSSRLGGVEGTTASVMRTIRRLYREEETGDFIAEFDSVSVPQYLFGLISGEPVHIFYKQRLKRVR